MPSPYPTSEHGYLGDLTKILIPPVIQAIMESAGRDVAMAAYRDGANLGWDRNSAQYTEELNLSRSIDYILKTQGVADGPRVQFIKGVDSLMKAILNRVY